MRIYFTQGARQSLRDIARDLHEFSPAASRRFRDRVRLRVRQLERHPELGRIVPEYDVRAVRELIEGDYRIWYRLYDDRVEILAIFHGARAVFG